MFLTIYKTAYFSLFPMVGKFLLFFLPIVLPLMLLTVWWIIRYRWVTMKSIESQKPCLLEIRIPKEIVRSPQAMEMLLVHLGRSGVDGYAMAYLDGKTRPWFSFELVSTGGQVRFFMWCSQGKYKDMVEAQLYAQYPNLEIFEAEDYTKDFYFDFENYPLRATQYYLGKPDVYPIKTYVEYEIGEDEEEEHKVDPITSVIEYLGSLGKGENAWIQIMFRKHERESWIQGKIEHDGDLKNPSIKDRILFFFCGKARDIKDEAKKEVEKIRMATLAVAEKGKEDKVMRFPNPTKTQQEVMAAIDRNSAKIQFDCICRGIYITEKGLYKPVHSSGMTGAFKQYKSAHLNELRSIHVGVEDWEDDFAAIFPFWKKHLTKKRRTLNRDYFYAYKLRSYFYWPYKEYGRGKPWIQFWKYDKPVNTYYAMSAESLATLFHFPGNMISRTPTLKRVESKKSEAPPNLPI